MGLIPSAAEDGTGGIRNSRKKKMVITDIRMYNEEMNE